MIDRKTCREISAKVQAALEEAFADTGITVKTGNGTFSPSKFTLKVDFTTMVGGKSNEELEFGRYASRYGLSADDFGKQFSRGGDTYTICGVKPRSSKYPILAKCLSNGKVYKFSADVVKALLGYTMTLPLRDRPAA
jgi:hypothetical protein